MKKVSNEDRYAAAILSHLQEMFDGSADNQIDLKELEDSEKATAFIHALSNIVPNMIYTKLTGNEQGNLDFNHIANKLCFQFSSKE